MVSDDLITRSFAVLPQDPRVADWARAALAEAKKITADPVQRDRWLRHGKTWFVGVDALTNGPDGAIGGVAFRGPWEGQIAIPADLHSAQLSVVYPGYPGRDTGESDAAFRYRRDRDAAHLDGLLAEGPTKQRHLREPHAWILGIPLNAATASPLVVWEGSHEIIREALMSELAGLPPSMWGDLDLTEVYKDARNEVFDLCERTEVRLKPGQSVIVHRLAIHGVAPWTKDATAPAEGRMMAYFRPVMSDLKAWLRGD